MASPTPDGRALHVAESRAWSSFVLLLGVITSIRLLVVFASPLELYPDEAQYWLWSQHLAFGYFSKPPLIAWIIALTTAAGRDGEPFVRLASPLLHALAGLAVAQTGRRLQDPDAGAMGGALYLLAPGVGLSAFVASTDAPLLAALALALLAYVRMLETAGRARLLAAAGLGLALGVAMLAKYAALFCVGGLVIHAAVSPPARKAWSPGALAAAIAAFLLPMAPNLAWNLSNGFATVAHTASDADWQGRRFSVVPVLTFLAAQFGVFGPVTFAVLAIGGAGLALRKALTPVDRLLLCFVLPPLAIIAAQAFIARANANWAAVAYPPAALLVGGWLVRWRARRLAGAALGSQALIAAALALGLAMPQMADRVGAANSLKRLRGWRETTRNIAQLADLEGLKGGLSAVAVDDRFLFNEAAYYGRGYFGRAGPPLRMWVRGAAPQNQAELTAPLTPALGRRVLAVSLEGRNTAAMTADFATSSDRQISQVSLDLKHWRSTTDFLGEGFQPRPRPSDVAR